MRTGKIAQLPKELRDEVNRMLDDNAGSKAIIAFLAKRGHLGINKVNISHWVHGDHEGSSGYLDWQREQRALAALRLQHEFALQLVQENKTHSLHEAARLLALSQLSQLFGDLDAQRLAESIPDKPQNYTRLLSALAKLSRDSRDYEQYQFRVAQLKRELEEKSKPGGLTPETLEMIERDVIFK